MCFSMLYTLTKVHGCSSLEMLKRYYAVAIISELWTHIPEADGRA